MRAHVSGYYVLRRLVSVNVKEERTSMREEGFLKNSWELKLWIVRRIRLVNTMRPKHWDEGRCLTKGKMICDVENRVRRSRRNQLIHRRFNHNKIYSQVSVPESQTGRRSYGYGGWCLELIREGRY